MLRLVQDLVFGLRMLRKSPAFTLVAVLTLALGIGVNTTIFSLINALLLRPVGGIQESERVVQLGGAYNGKGFNVFSFPNYLEVRDRNTIFSGVAVRQKTSFDVSNGERTKRVGGEAVSGNYFDVLGVRAFKGRTLTTEDDTTPGANPVAVISAALWQEEFGSSGQISGETIYLNSQPFTVIGVISEDFNGMVIGEKVDVWIPISMAVPLTPFLASSNIDWYNKRDATWIMPVARLKDGVTLQQAQAELTAISQGLAQEYPKSNSRLSLVIDPNTGMTPISREAARQYTLLLMGIVAIVLLIACANVANLQLARAVTRQKEIGIRLALGAGRWQIIRQLFIESLLLSLFGGLTGILISVWLNEMFLALLPQTQFLAIPTQLDLSLDFRVLAFTLAASILTGVMFGLFPAWQASKADLIAVLKESKVVGNKAEKSRLRNALVVLQVALSLILMIAAGLVIQTLRNAQAVNLGFDTENIITASVDLGRHNYSQPRGQNFYQQLSERAQALPGVERVSLASHVLLSGSAYGTDIRVEGQAENINVRFNTVTPDYFATLNIPLLMGRNFSQPDKEGAPAVIIISEALARRLWDEENPLGKRFEMLGGIDKGKIVEVIGVARDVKAHSLFENSLNYAYLPFSQNYNSEMSLHLRATANPEALLAAIRSEVNALDKNLPLAEVTTLAMLLKEVLAPQRVNAALIAAFGLLALLLASIGLYGVMAYTVTQRTHEIGIRMALGAQQKDALLLIMEQGAKLIALGVALGIACALAVTRTLNSLLFGVSAIDTRTFMVVGLILTGVALLACWIPARRATKVDPMVALRYE